MSPFQEYQQKAKEAREEYDQRIKDNPAQKAELEAELKTLLAKLLDEAENKEILRSKYL